MTYNGLAGASLRKVCSHQHKQRYERSPLDTPDSLYAFRLQSSVLQAGLIPGTKMVMLILLIPKQVGNCKCDRMTHGTPTLLTG